MMNKSVSALFRAHRELLLESEQLRQQNAALREACEALLEIVRDEHRFLGDQLAHGDSPYDNGDAQEAGALRLDHLWRSIEKARATIAAVERGEEAMQNENNDRGG